MTTLRFTVGTALARLSTWMLRDRKPHPMQQFHDMLRYILDHGSRQVNERTGEEVLFVPGYTLKFDMADGFPAITTKQLFFKMAKGELFGFFRGFTSAAQFREIGCTVWDDNANKTKAWLANPHRKGLDDLGRFGYLQWSDWRDWREASSKDDADALVKQGFEIRSHDSSRNIWVLRRSINQLETSLRGVMTNPSDRGIILTGWNPAENDQGCLRSCHVSYMLQVDISTGKLHLSMWQRSFDAPLAYNVAIGAMYLEIMARLAGLEAGTFTHFISDAHIYAKHIPGVELQLSREHFPQPTLDLGNIPTLKSVDEIPGIFTKLDPEQVKLVNYKHHPKIPYEMTP
ncbi:thymidylate synthase [Burkholderia ubonensis]|uniref:thymidylate synthase n=1 Tax=Burkholderia ubonensis TaxID=101571 RepID=UPI001E4ECB32|nr:thymidylate synthase [Burkholderia ubonensis]